MPAYGGEFADKLHRPRRCQTGWRGGGASSHPFASTRARWRAPRIRVGIPRRMAESAAQLIDEVIPRGPVRQWVLSGCCLGAVVSDIAAYSVRSASRVACAGAAHHPPGHRGLSAQAGGARARRRAHRHGPWGFSRRPGTQGVTGFAMAPMTPRGLRWRMAVRVRRNRPTRGHAEADKLKFSASRATAPGRQEYR